MPLALPQSNLNEELSPSFRAGRKLGEVEQGLLWTLLREDPQCPSRLLLGKIAKRQIPIVVSLRHLNRWRATRQLNRHKGRPCQAPDHCSVASGAPLVPLQPRL
jgi:hypothetical protein